jgi:hypothetical protein
MRKITLLLLSLALITQVSAQRIFVKSDASGSGDGSSWDDAYTDLIDALAGAVANDTIFVASGIYYPASTNRDIAFTLVEGVKLFGGFSGVETTFDASTIENRDFEANETVLSGDLDGVSGLGNKEDNSYRVVEAINLSSATEIDGFTIRDGFANGGSDNSKGAGLFISTSSIVMNNLMIHDNEASANGGGIYIGEGSYISLTNSSIYNNIAYYGGGIQLWNSSSFISDCYIYQNEIESMGGGIYNYVHYTTPGDTVTGTTIINTTITENVSTDIMNGGGGIYNWCYDNNLTIINCIIYDNEANFSVIENRDIETFPEESYAYPYISYSLIGGSGGSDSWNTSSGIDNGNNIDEDPLFVKADEHDFRIFTGSPAAGSGDATYGTNIGAYQEAEIPLPVISVTESINNFGSVATGVSSSEQSFTVEGSDLLGDLVVTAPDGFELSLVSEDYSGETDIITLTPSPAGTVSETTIYLRFRPINTIEYSGYVSINSMQTTPYEISVSGTGFEYIDPSWNVVYVKLGAVGDSTGSSWDNAYPTIYMAMDSVASRTIVYVAQGTYREKYLNVWEDSLKIYGSLEGTETDIDTDKLATRDFDAHATIISVDINGDDGSDFTNMDDNLSRCFTIDTKANITFDGFILEGGKANAYSVFDKTGGGLRIEYSDLVTINNCIFRNNYAPYNAGAIDVSVSDDVTISNCLIYNNKGNNYGGGLRTYESTVSLVNTTITKNYCPNSESGAIANFDSELEVINAIITNNYSYTGLDMEGNHIYNNSTLTFEYSLIENSGGSEAWNEEFGTDLGNNIETDPWFVNVLEDDYQLFDISPALGSGNIVYGENMGYYQGEGIVSGTLLLIDKEYYEGGTQDLFTYGPEEYFTVSGTGLTADIIVTAPDQVQISLVKGEYTPGEQSIILTAASGKVDATRIYFKYAPTEVGEFEDSIMVSSSELEKYINTTGTCTMPTDPLMVLSADTLKFGEILLGVPSVEQSFTVAGVNLTDNLRAWPQPGFELSLTSGDFSSGTEALVIPTDGGTLEPTEIFVRFNPSEAGEYNVSQYVQTSGGGAVTMEKVILTGSCVTSTDPILSVQPTSLAFGDVYMGSSSEEQQIQVAGFNLSEDITITIPDGFEITNTSGSYTAGITELTLAVTDGTLAATTLYARYTPETPSTDNGQFVFTSGDLTERVMVSGTGMVNYSPHLTVSPPEINFGTIDVGSSSSELTIDFSGFNLSDDVEIEAPAGFEITLTSGGYSGNTGSITYPISASTLSQTTVYIRFTPTDIGAYSGSVVISSGEATETVPVTGTGAEEGQILSNTALAESTNINVFPNPVSDKLYITSNQLSDIQGISLLNAQGSLIDHPNSENTELDFSTLPAGIYFLRVELKHSVEVIRVIKK